MRRSIDLENAAVIDVAQLMAAAARTAPKTRGVDNIEVICIDDEETKSKLMEKMKEISVKESRPSMERDANAIAASSVMLVIGVKANPAGLNCGFCGYKTCDELKKTSGICAYNSIDLGISSCSAAAMASQFHIDNRMMHSMGRASIDLRLFGSDVRQAIGIPLSATGKSPYFDRK